MPEQPLPPAQSAAQAKGKKGGAVVVLVLIAVMVVLVGVLVVALALRGRSDGGKPPAQQAGAAQAGPAMVGQPVSLDGVQYTVVRVEQQASGNNLYVMVELELENAGSKTVNAAYMISLVVDGYVYEKAHDEINMISAAGLDKLPNTANLGPGTKKRGGLIFKVPKDAAAMELVIDSGSSSIRIQLADGKQRAGLGSIRQVNP